MTTNKSLDEDITLAFQKKMWAKHFLSQEDDTDKFWSYVMKLLSGLRRIIVQRLHLLKVSEINDPLLSFDFRLVTNDENSTWKLLEDEENTVEIDRKSRKLLSSHSELIRNILVTIEDLVFDAELERIDSKTLKFTVVLGHNGDEDDDDTFQEETEEEEED